MLPSPLSVKQQVQKDIFFFKISFQSCRILFVFQTFTLKILVFSCPFVFISKAHKYSFIKSPFTVLDTAIKGVTE